MKTIAFTEIDKDSQKAINRWLNNPDVNDFGLKGIKDYILNNIVRCDVFFENIEYIQDFGIGGHRPTGARETTLGLADGTEITWSYHINGGGVYIVNYTRVSETHHGSK